MREYKSRIKTITGMQSVNSNNNQIIKGLIKRKLLKISIIVIVYDLLLDLHAFMIKGHFNIKSPEQINTSYKGL